MMKRQRSCTEDEMLSGLEKQVPGCPGSRGRLCKCDCQGKNHGKFEQLPLFGIDKAAPGGTDKTAKITARRDKNGKVTITTITYE